MTMKPANFHLANLGVHVSISPDARRWVQEHVVSLETYAWAQAQRRQAGLPLDIGVTVTLDCEEGRRRTFGLSPSKMIETPPSTVEARGFTYSAPIASAPAPVEDGWPRWIQQPDSNGRPCALVRIDSLEGGVMFCSNGSTLVITALNAPGWPDSATKQQHRCSFITPAAAADWLRANGHAQAANEIEVLDEFEPVEVRPIKGDRMKKSGDSSQVFVAVADGTADTFPDCRWQTPVSHGSHVLTLKTGLGYRILRRQPAKLRDGRGR